MIPKKDESKVGTTALILGAGSAGLLELSLFHPVDTVAKRLMNNRTNVCGVVSLLCMAILTSAAILFTPIDLVCKTPQQYAGECKGCHIWRSSSKADPV